VELTIASPSTGVEKDQAQDSGPYADHHDERNQGMDQCDERTGHCRNQHQTCDGSDY
jgi:hypothetical protein